MLDGTILEHAVEFMDKGSLNNFWCLGRTDSSGSIVVHAQ